MRSIFICLQSFKPTQYCKQRKNFCAHAHIFDLSIPVLRGEPCDCQKRFTKYLKSIISNWTTSGVDQIGLSKTLGLEMGSQKSYLHLNALNAGPGLILCKWSNDLGGTHTNVIICNTRCGFWCLFFTTFWEEYYLSKERGVKKGKRCEKHTSVFFSTPFWIRQEPNKN